MTDHIQQFIDAMHKEGIGPSSDVSIEDNDTPTYYRIEGDKPNQKRGSYALKCDPDGFACGWFLSHKEGITHSWHSKATRGISDEERKAHQERVAKSKREREAAIAKSQSEAAEKAAGIWSGASKEGETGYLLRKGIPLNGARIHDGRVAVPMHKDGALVGLQFISDDGEKKFIYGAEKKGAYHSMRGPDLSVIRVCEGFATGAAIREVFPENPVIVAFDAGNLKPVVTAMVKKYPDATIVICADNDQWSVKGANRPAGYDSDISGADLRWGEWLEGGYLFNTGVVKAGQAAVANGGLFVKSAPFAPNDEEKRTDWDDYLRAFGVEETREAMMHVVIDVPEMDTPFDGEDVVEGDTPMRPHLERIRPLGISEEGKYLFFPLSSGRIVSLTSSQLTQIGSLLTLVADLGFWEMYYGIEGEKPNNTQIALHAAVELISECDNLGVFRSDDSRSVGAWEDNGKFIVNTGKRIIGKGIDVATSEYKGDYIYTSGVNVIDLNVKPLEPREAQGIYDICHNLVWKRDCYSKLFAGWMVVAGVGGALDWRPHIWLTGRSGAGKSTAMDEIVKRLLSSVAVIQDGGTTEAGVRKFIGTSSRPFLMDEAESETQKDRAALEAIVGLFRKASSGGVVGNANGTFNARSCACFSAINPSLTETADLARITLLELEVNRSSNRKAHFEKLISDIEGLFHRGFDKRLFKFVFDNIETLVDNIRVFRAAATTMFGNARTADQLAPMLAGAFLLTDIKRVTLEEAKAWIEQDDWDWFTSIGQENDSEKLVAHIMTSRVGYDSLGMRREGTIGDLIDHVIAGGDGSGDIEKGLRSYGIRLDDGYVLIANNGHNMTKLLRDTPWVPWARTLGDFAGSHNHGNKTVYFMKGVSSKIIAVPLDALGDLGVSEEVELPITEEDFA